MLEVLLNKDNYHGFARSGREPTRGHGKFDNFQ